MTLLEDKIKKTGGGVAGKEGELIEDEIDAIYGKSVQLESNFRAAIQWEQTNKDGSLPKFATFIAPAMTDRPSRPNWISDEATVGNEIRVSCCPGEYESATVIVHAFTEVKDLAIVIGGFVNGEDRLPADCVDLRVVKSWYKAAGRPLNLKVKSLVPELLLKDDKLIAVNNLGNYAKISRSDGGHKYVCISDAQGVREGDSIAGFNIKDAKTLQPFDIDAQTNKQLWITIRPPKNATPKSYSGKLVLQVDGKDEAFIKITIEILPFALDAPLLDYGMFYSSHPAKAGSITMYAKSDEQYHEELCDLKAHGVSYPHFYQRGAFDWNCFERELGLRERVDFPRDKIYIHGDDWGGFYVQDPQDPFALGVLSKKIKRLMQICRKYGYGEIYFYGIDEASGKRLVSQKPAWSVLRQAGAKIYASGYIGTYEAVGQLLDLILYPYRPCRQEALKWHDDGRKIWCYAYPQPGAMPHPKVYRRHYGFELWKANYDGASGYAYQASFGHIWNGFDSSENELCFTYPTADGVIDTIEWEGWREGVDDVRYLTTLLNIIEEIKSKADDRRKNLAGNIEKWIEALGEKDMAEPQVVREEIIARIRMLKKEEK
ncbi:MAG: hypothetical protein PHV34_07150 [Verrucomicrobiae bacterium]|nr:hypothetical protein [Verrucomicrobiae bacterium]